MRRIWKRYMAFLLAFLMTFSNVAGSLTFAAEGLTTASNSKDVIMGTDDPVFSISSDDLLSAIASHEAPAETAVETTTTAAATTAAVTTTAEAVTSAAETSAPETSKEAVETTTAPAETTTAAVSETSEAPKKETEATKESTKETSEAASEATKTPAKESESSIEETKQTEAPKASTEATKTPEETTKEIVISNEETQEPKESSAPETVVKVEETSKPAAEETLAASNENNSKEETKTSAAEKSTDNQITVASLKADYEVKADFENVKGTDGLSVRTFVKGDKVIFLFTNTSEEFYQCWIKIDDTLLNAGTIEGINENQTYTNSKYEMTQDAIIAIEQSKTNKDETTAEDLENAEVGATESDASEEIPGSYTYNGVTVHVLAPAGAFPAGTILTIKPITSSAVKNAVKDAVEDGEKEVTGTVAFDITFTKDGEELQPDPEHPVSVTFDVAKSSTIVDEKSDTLQVFHMEDENSTAEPVSEKKEINSAASKNNIAVEATSFSIYVIGTTSPTNMLRRTYKFFNGSAIVDTQIVKSGDDLIEPQIPTSSTGNKFLGWSKDGGKTYQTFGKFTDAVTEDLEEVDLYAQFEQDYYVTFYNENNTVQHVVAGKTNTVVPTTTADVSFDVAAGRALVGWTKKKGSSADIVSSVTIEQSNISLYPIVEDVKWITFDGNGAGASYTAPEYVIPGSAAAKPNNNPSRRGYTFVGWCSDAAGNNEFDFTTKITEDKTLYAKWMASTANYSVIFWKQQVADAKTATDANKKYDYAESVTRSANTGSNVSVTTDDISKTYTGFHYNSSKQTTVTVAADGSSILNVYYDRNLLTINFYTSSGQGRNKQWSIWDTYTGLYGSTLLSNSYTYPTSSYSWNSAKGGNGTTLTYLDAFLFDGLAYASNNTLNLYAQSKYTKVILHYTQNIDGTWTLANTTYGTGGIFTFTNKYVGFTVAQYRALYGSWDGDYWSAWQNITTGDSVDQGYKELDVRHTRNNYNLDYKDLVYESSSNDNLIKSEPVPYQKPLTSYNYTPDAPANLPDYMKFGGWYKDPGFTEAFDFTQTMPANNMVAYAKWVAKDVTVSFDSNGGSAVSNTTILAGNSVNKPEDPVKAGYKFAGWMDGESAFNFNTKLYSDTTLTAKWILSSEIKVMYNANGGTNAPSDTNNYVDGTKATVLDAATPVTGYLFLGWKLGQYVYKPGEVFDVKASDAKVNSEGTYTVTLTALYGTPASKTTLTYKANGGDGSDFTVTPEVENNTSIILKSEKDLSYSYKDHYFSGWNTKSDGSGDAYSEGETVAIDNLSYNVLYAQWKNKIEITNKGVSDTKVYTGKAQIITGFTTEGLGDTASLTGLDFSATGTNVDVYTGVFSGQAVITENGVNVTDHYIINNVPGKLTITKAPATQNAVTATPYSGVYDANAHTITASAAQIGSTLYYSTDNTTWDTEAPTWTDVTAAQTVYVKATNPNYEDAFGQATVTITQKPVTVTANSYNKKYGEEDPTFAATVAGTLGTDTVTYTLSRAAGENVGTYTITPAGDASQGNYSVTYATGTLTITKAPATQNAVTATPYSGVYDANAHTITASAVQTGSTLYYSTDNTTWDTEAPTWTDVTAAQTVYVKATNPNYEDAFGQATVTITQKPVTVTANSYNKKYGEEDPTFAATVAGTLGTDTVTYTLSRAAGENVGTYTITPAGDASQGNYSVTYATGTLTIVASNQNAVTATPYSGVYDANAHTITASAAQTGSTLYYSTDNTTWDTEAPTWTDVTAAQTVYVKATNPNYEDAFGQATVTITQKPVTVTANSYNKKYGEEDPTFAATVAGTLGTDTVTYTLSRAAGENVGTYTITPAGDASQGNYSVTYATGTLTITKAPATQNAVTATPYSGVYDANAHTITASAAQTGSTLYYSTDNTTWDTEAPTWTDVTAAQTVYVKATNPNYEDAFGQATVTITQKPVTVTANSYNKKYGEEDPTFAATVAGTLGTDTVTYTLSRAAGENVGTYTITPAGDASQGNYSVTYATGTLTITKAPATQNAVTATPYSGVYDANAHTITASAAQTGSTLYYSTDNTTWDTEAPTWTDVTAAQTVYVKATNPNYEDAFGQATVTITQKPVTVTANSYNKKYGEEDPTFAATVAGTLGTDTVTYTLSRAAGENVGTYTITPAGDASQGNYSVTYATGTLTITKAPATQNAVTATPYSGVYDANAHTITASAAQTGSTLYYSTDNTTWDTEAPTWTDVTAAQTVYVKATNPNYEDAFGQATVTITQKPVTVTANSYNKKYGEEDPTFAATVAGTLGTDTVTYTLSRAAGENVGTYTITPAGDASQGNYSVTYATGTLTITKAPATQNAVTATPYNHVYDANAHTITASAVQTGSTLYYSTDNTTWDTEAPTWTDVTAAQTVYVKATNPNYEDAFGQATVTITQKPVTVTANSYNKKYGEEDPTFAATVAGTLGTDTVTYTLSRAAGENVGTYTITPAGDASQGNYSVTYATGTLTIVASDQNAVTATPYSGVYDANAHTITASAAQTGSTLYYSTDNTTWDTEAPTWTDVTAAQTVYVKATNPNYEDAFGQATVTITQKPVTVTANSYNKKYGEEDPTFAATVAGTLGTDTVTYTLSRAAGENVGTYTITPAGDASQGNYSVTYATGTLTITKAPATQNAVTATPYSGVYDANAHTITASAAQTGSTLYYSTDNTTWDTEAPTWTDVTAAQTVYVKATNPNYEDAFGQATVTITQKPVTVTANSYNKKYGEEDPTFAATVAGTLGTDTVTYTLSRAAGENVGTYTITPAGDASQGNYSVTYATGTLTITKAPATQNAVTATPYSGVYDANAHTITASAAQTGSTLYYSTDNTTWDTEAPTWTDVTAAQTVYVKATNPNYEDAFGQATVTITQKPVTVTANSYNKKYGEEDPTFAATVAGTLGTDTVTYTLSRAAGENVGTYTITPAGDASQGNYSVTYATGTLTITKAPATQNAVTATPYSGVYDANAHTITASAAQTGSTLYYSTDNTTWDTEAPTWTDVTAAQTVYVKATNPNYEDAFGQATVTITQKPVTVTANSYNKKYGEEDPTFAATVAGTLGTDTVTYTLSRAAGENVGTYTITPAGDASQGNYSVTYATGTLTITKAPATQNAVTATPYNHVYDANAHTITASAVQTGSTLYYSTDNTTWDTEAPTWTDVTAAQTVYVKATNPNYEDAFGQATVTITQKPVTVTANSYNKKYGEEDPTFAATVAGTLGTDTVTYTLSRAAGENVGTYTITPAGDASQGNYSVTYATGTLTIVASDQNAVTATPYSGVYDANAHTITASAAQTGSTLYYSTDNTTWDTEAPTWTDVTAAQTVYVKATNPNYEDAFGQATVTITQKPVTVTANSYNKKYGEEDPTFAATVAGTLGTDTVTYTLSRAAGENVGTYTITPAGDASQGNYSVTYATGTLTITKAPATQNAVTATPYSGVYDANAHTITASAVQTGSTLYYSTDNTTWDTEAPTWTDVTAAQTVYVKATNPNYEDAFGQATVTITQKPVTVTANSYNKKYGEEDPTFAATVAGTLGTDTVTYTLSRAAGENVGTYTITPAGDASQGNYNVTYATGTLTITKALAEQNAVTATPYDAEYDADAHTILASSLVSEGTTLYYSTDQKSWSETAPTWTDVTEAQTVYVKAENPNYEDAFGKATVTITKRPIEITSGSKSFKFDNQDHSYDYYEITKGSLAGKDGITKHSITGVQKEIGKSFNTFEFVVISKNQDKSTDLLTTIGNAILKLFAISSDDVTSNYDITLKEGVLEVTRPEDLAYQVHYFYEDAAGTKTEDTGSAIIGTNGVYDELISNHYKAPEQTSTFNGSNYVFEKIDGAGKKISLNASENVVNIYYAIDEKGGHDPETPVTPEEPDEPDNIPDKYETIFQYVSAGNGTVTGNVYEVHVFKDEAGNYTAKSAISPAPSITITANSNYKFSTWTDLNDSTTDANAEMATLKARTYTDDTTFQVSFAYAGGGNNGGSNGGGGSTVISGGRVPSGTQTTDTINEPDVPLADTVTIGPDEVPLGALPKTGQDRNYWESILFAMFALTIAVLAKREEEKRKKQQGGEQ